MNALLFIGTYTSFVKLPSLYLYQNNVYDLQIQTYCKLLFLVCHKVLDAVSAEKDTKLVYKTGQFKVTTLGFKLNAVNKSKVNRV